ncbi:MAG: PKD domain-containing protein [Thermoplasmatota archaeon]
MRAEGPLIVGSEPSGDPTLSEGGNVTLSVSLAPGAGAELRWFVDGTFQNESGESFTYRPDHKSAGVHNVTVEARTASAAEQRSWSVTVTNLDLPMSVGGRDPPGDFGIPLGGSRRVSVELSNPDGDPLTIQWFLNGALVLGASEPELLLQATGDLSSPILVRFWVSDGESEAELIWNVSIERAAVAVPEGDVEMAEGESRTFRILGADGGLSWFLDGVPLNASGSCWTYSPGPSDEGVHNVSVRADGSLLSLWRVTVLNRNQPPVLSSGRVVEALVGEPVALTAVAFDPDGRVELYEWDLDGDGATDVSSSTSPNLTRSFASPGERRLVLRATDNEGATSETVFLVVIKERPSLMSWWLPAAALGAAVLTLLLVVAVQARWISIASERREREGFFVRGEGAEGGRLARAAGGASAAAGAGAEVAAQPGPERESPPESGGGEGAIPAVPEAEEEIEVLRVKPSLADSRAETEVEAGEQGGDVLLQKRGRDGELQRAPRAEPARPESAGLLDRGAESESRASETEVRGEMESGRGGPKKQPR